MKLLQIISLYSCLASFMFANEMQTKEYWINFLIHNDKSQQSKNFANEYFEPILQNKKGEIVCLDTDGEKFCFYKILKPLHLKGILTFRQDYQNGACQEIASWQFVSNDTSLPIFLQTLHPQLQNLASFQLPKWFQDKVAGEVSYEVEFDIINALENAEIPSKFALSADYYPCGASTDVAIQNLKIHKQHHAKLYKRDNYENTIEYNYNLYLHTNDLFVNLRESPNGKIITQIPTKESEKILLWNLDYTDYNNTLASDWVKVLYFPAHARDFKEAFVGFIHKSQITTQKTKISLSNHIFYATQK